MIQSHLIMYYTKLNSIGTMVVMKLENKAVHTLKENKYPEIQLEVTNANETVLGMIQHVKQ